MGAKDALRNSLEHAAIVNAEMGIVIHRMGVKPQVERVGLEEVMVDQRDKGIQHAGKGENRCQSDVLLSFTLGQFLHIPQPSAWNKVMMFRITSEAFIILSSGTYSNLP